MFKKRFLVILVPLIIIILVTISIAIIIDNWGKISNPFKEHTYYPELTEFTFGITDNPINHTKNNADYPSPIFVEYVKQELHQLYHGKMMVYFFKTTDNNSMSLMIPSGIADEIQMIPGEKYTIDYRIHPGWPFHYLLIIYKGESMIFVGRSDSFYNEELNLNGTSIWVSQGKVLTDHYIKGDGTWLRKTNTEIRFTLGGDSINLHQGQSGTLGDYDITLLIARKIEYQPICYDCGQNGISYVVSRNN